MTDLSVETDAVTAFAATNSVVAANVASAGITDAAGNVAAMTPVFGLIGADYLAMFAVAQTLQAKDINDLSAKFSSLSDAAFKTSVTFETEDLSRAADLARQTAGIGGGA
ncbi:MULTISPECIES: type VII secretion target [unclassified Nocardia]|uniref:type VII secretion target n=1 Tax=unclassified Nocardia TaxID=2637762 RepID=UPI002418B1AF|nr:type VII secretion target [Nocardia sp. AG03]